MTVRFAWQVAVFCLSERNNDTEPSAAALEALTLNEIPVVSEPQLYFLTNDFGQMGRTEAGTIIILFYFFL